MILAASTAEEVAEAVLSADRVLPTGGGTKRALSGAPHPGVATVDVSGLRGIVEYDPAELTLTARAGTPVAEVDAALAEHGQYLPFDPLLREAGATLGGAVAAGASGPGAFRHGGIRDFVIGVQLVDGTGTLVAGGGRVVKNAAGFDLPKLMVSSLGRLGVMVRLSFKVFPRPRATTTAVFELDSLAVALPAMARLGRGPVALDALDLEPPGRLAVRVGGAADDLAARAERVAEGVGAPMAEHDRDDSARWRTVTELTWLPADHRAVRVALTPGEVPALEAALAAAGARARYSLGAAVAWVAWPAAEPLGVLGDALGRIGLTGVPLTGEAPATPLLGTIRGGAFATRVRAALDPGHRFEDL